MSPAPTTTDTDAVQWVSLTAAARAGRMTPYSVLRWAMAGCIQTQLVPGIAAKYSLPDVLSLRQSILG